MINPGIFIALIIAIIATSNASASEVNVYSARKENLIKPLLDKFSAETGIKTNLITANADKLLTRMENEGRNTPADVLITTDAGRLYRAKQAGLLQAVQSARIDQLVPENLRDVDHQWVGLSQRARVIFYRKNRVDPGQLSSYEDLADPKWKKRICIRGSGNIYNQSMVASMIAANGEQETLRWARAFVQNFARKPMGGDRDQIKAAASGQCDIAIANTYYYGKMQDNTRDSSERQAAEKMAIFWPNQSGRGAHVNVSGAAVSRYAKNRDNAIKLLEFLVGAEAQVWYASVNHEFPVVANAQKNSRVASWGEFESDLLNLSKLGELNSTAVKIMDRAGWL